ncbi:MAG: HAD-IA family hydrolase [Bryobacteraceae bacterium]|nr:HAD-IA family hydrolase [Bryobacteraceae bacterium]MDW8376718.1 HAD-IA family hydrolase [Bryobacterales bacterium]
MQLIIFDLDGTLIDSQRDLVNAVNAARRHMGLSELDPPTVQSYVGDGAPTLIRRALGPQATESEVEQALAFFLQYYRQHMLDYTVLYDGVREVLEVFRGVAIPMAVLTNKPAHIAQAILEGLGISNHFFRIYGGNSFAQKKPDPVGVYALLQESGAARERTVLVGDSAVDVRTARNAGVLACGVTYGFQPHTFQTDPPDYLLHHMSELVPVVLG